MLLVSRLRLATRTATLAEAPAASAFVVVLVLVVVVELVAFLLSISRPSSVVFLFAFLVLAPRNTVHHMNCFLGCMNPLFGLEIVEVKGLHIHALGDRP